MTTEPMIQLADAINARRKLTHAFMVLTALLAKEEDLMADELAPLLDILHDKMAESDQRLLELMARVAPDLKQS